MFISHRYGAARRLGEVVRSHLIMSGLAWASLDFAIAPAARAAEPSPPAPVQPVAPSADDPLRGTMLAMHNATRARVGVPPLAWDATLAGAARSYAEDMARTDVFRHSPPSMRRGASPTRPIWSMCRCAQMPPSPIFCRDRPTRRANIWR